MKVRHQPRLGCDQLEQIGIDLGRVDRGQAKPRQLRHQPQETPCHLAEGGLARQIAAVRGEIHAGQNDFLVTTLDQTPSLRDDLTNGNAAARPTAIGNDAEGAAVIAAILHLNERARTPLQPVDQVAGGFLNVFGFTNDDAGGFVLSSQRLPRRRGKLFAIAEDVVDFAHLGIGVRRNLRAAAGDHDPGIRALAPGPPDRLARLTLGFGGHGAGVNDDDVIQSGLGCLASDDLGFETVQTTAEGNDV